MVRTFLKVDMELGSSFLFLQEQTKDIIIIILVSRKNGTKTYYKSIKKYHTGIKLSYEYQKRNMCVSE
jgi:hypothetical protein